MKKRSTKQQQTNKVNFPDLTPIFYRETSTSIDSVIKEIITLFLSLDTPIWTQAANKLKEYSISKTPLRDIDGLTRHLKKWKKKNGYSFGIEITKRKKSLIKMLLKIFLFIQKSENATSDEEKRKYSLDSICDANGIRLIVDLGKTDNSNAIETLDEIANEIIYYFLFKAHYICKVAEPLLETQFNEDEHKDVYVPTNCLINDEYLVNVKDYYRNPKQNGYQSLHFVFQSPRGLTIEVQLRTLATHMRVEYEKHSCHDAHDKFRYSELPDGILDFDFTKVNIQNFRCLPTGEIYDAICFYKSSEDNVI